MIYYCCAMYCEAKPVIEYYKMKRIAVKGRYQFFESPEAVLTICGTGRDNANSAATLLCSKFPPKDSDIFVNWGICGAFSETVKVSVGDIFMAWGVKNIDGNIIYTDSDLVCPWDFKKALLCTFPKKVNTPGEIRTIYDGENPIALVDMEGYGAVFSASLFFECHRIFMLKTVSDIIGEKTASELNSEFAEKIISKAFGQIVKYIEAASVAVAENKVKYASPVLLEDEMNVFEKFSEFLCLSAAMKEQLMCLLIKRKLQLKSISELMIDFMDTVKKEENYSQRTICRNDGKVLFHRFKEYEVSHA